MWIDEASRDAARASLLETLASIYVHADDVDPIHVAERTRVRLACTNAIHDEIEVADFIYKAAGVDANRPPAVRSNGASAISTRSHSKFSHGTHTSRP
jgi:hypothetical protein